MSALYVYRRVDSTSQATQQVTPVICKFLQTHVFSAQSESPALASSRTVVYFSHERAYSLEKRLRLGMTPRIKVPTEPSAISTLIYMCLSGDLRLNPKQKLR